MHIDRLTKRYARALYRHAAKQGDQEAVWADLQALADGLQQRPDLQVVLEHPDISAQAKVRKLREIIDTGGRISETTAKFLRLVVENRRPRVLPAAAAAFLQQWDADRGVRRALVRTARELTDENRAALKDALKRLTGSEVVLDIEVDEDLIGGFSVRIGDRVFDGTIKKRFDRITEAVARRVQKARQQREI